MENLSIVVGVVLLVLVIGGATTTMIMVPAARRAAARRRAALEAEGIELDSGPQSITVRLRAFRAPGLATMLTVFKTRASLILTRKRFMMTPAQREFHRIDREALARYDVGVEDGALVIHTDDPPNASGSLEYRVVLPDAGAWVKALTEAGARPRQTHPV